MKKLLILLSGLVFCSMAVAQDFKANRTEAEKIKNDTAFFWYHGDSDFESVDEALEQAVKGLVDKIRVEYKAHLCPVSGDFNAHKKNVFATFEPFVDDNIDYLILKEGDKNECFVYLGKESFRNECAKRCKEIDMYLETGDLTYEKQNYGDALRYYYIALMLCYAHPDGDNIMCFDNELQKEVKMMSYLTNRINGDDGILGSVRLLVKDWKKDGAKNIVTMNVSMSDGTSLSNINIKYNNGKYNETTNVHNGFAQMEVYGETDNVTVESVDAEIDLFYKDIECESPIAFKMMKNLRKKQQFAKTAKTVKNITGDVREPSHDIVEKPKAIDESTETYIVKDEVLYVEKMKEIERALRNKDYESVRGLFSDEGYGFFKKLGDYGTTSVIGTPQYKLFQYKNEVYVRSIPMRFVFNSESFTHDIVFRFDSESKLVTSIAFRLTEIAEHDIWSNPWSIESRIILMNFLEDYQTAYAFGQLEYLKRIFSDDALIIIGHVVEYKPVSTDDIDFGINKKVDFLKKTKAEYVKDLERQFRTKKYINIHFTNLEVKRAGGNEEDVYGVQVRQYYNSSNYNDDGYLFLMVDLRGELPVIHVRTWQPGKTDIKRLITLRDFL